jgi:hypothetical protein
MTIYLPHQREARTNQERQSSGDRLIAIRIQSIIATQGDAMRFITNLFIATFCCANLAHAQTPCDFKGVSVGDRMTPAETLAAFGVTKYKTNPARSSFEEMMVLSERYGMMAASELEDWKIGPYCQDTSCRIPYGVTVGNANTPVNVFVSFHQGIITEIDVSFSAIYWDQMLPILDQKYGADWTVDRSDTVVTNFETNKSKKLELIVLKHVTNGTNARKKDRCQISAQNIDMVFEHLDAYGPYHSSVTIQLVSKNF